MAVNVLRDSPYTLCLALICTSYIRFAVCVHTKAGHKSVIDSSYFVLWRTTVVGLLRSDYSTYVFEVSEHQDIMSFDVLKCSVIISNFY